MPWFDCKVLSATAVVTSQDIDLPGCHTNQRFCSGAGGGRKLRGRDWFTHVHVEFKTQMVAVREKGSVDFDTVFLVINEICWSIVSTESQRNCLSIKKKSKALCVI